LHDSVECRILHDRGFRSSTTVGPMSGAQLDQMAPTLAQARKAITVSGRFGM